MMRWLSGFRRSESGVGIWSGRGIHLFIVYPFMMIEFLYIYIYVNFHNESFFQNKIKETKGAFCNPIPFCV